jgi:hypothetical protein
MTLITLAPDDERGIRQAAGILTLAFREHWPDSWATLEDALAEVHAMLAPDCICRAACEIQQAGDPLRRV